MQDFIPFFAVGHSSSSISPPNNAEGHIKESLVKFYVCYIVTANLFTPLTWDCDAERLVVS